MQNKSQPSVRIPWIDIARGIAIIAVIFGHTISNPNNADFLVNFIYLFHMPIFFFLSGLLYHEKKAKVDLKSLTASVFKPYFVTAVLMILIWYLQAAIKSKYLFTFFPNAKQLFLSILYGVGLPPMNPFGWQLIPIGAIWFLLAFYIGRLIFGSVMRLVKSDMYRGIIFLALTVIGAEITPHWLLPWSLNGALVSLPYLFVGYLIKKYDIMTHIPNFMYFIFIAYWILTAKQLPTYLLVSPTIHNLWIQFPVSIMAILVVCRLSKFIGTRFAKTSSVLKWYGAGSLIILCFHLLQLEFDNGFQLIMYHYHWDSGALWVDLLWSLYRIVFPTIVLLVVRKIPWLSYLFFPVKHEQGKQHAKA